MPVLTQIGTGGLKNNAVTSAKIGVDVIVADDIANNAVTVAELASNAVSTVKIVDSAVTTAKINDGAVTAAKLASGVSDLSNDTTPQLGGNLASNGNDILFADNDKAIFGAGSDLQIYHDGSNSYIDDAAAGNLNIRASRINFQKYTGETMAEFIADGATSLRYDNVTKLATKSDGVDITGELQADSLDIDGAANISSTLTMSGGNIDFIDGVEARFGTSNDLRIYHDGSNSYISDGGTGNLNIRATDLRIQNGAGTEFYMTADVNSAVQLYHDNTVRIATDAEGVTVTGRVLADGLALGDNDKAIFGSGNDFEIFHDGSNTYLAESAGTGNVYLRANNLVLLNNSNEVYINCVSDGAVSLYYDNSAKLVTTSTGLSVTGAVAATGAVTAASVGSDANDRIEWSNNAYIRFIVNGSEEARLEADGDFHADGDVIAYSTTISDERLKENIQPIDNALDKVNQLNGVTFTYKADGKESAGLIAQDVEKVLPSAVSEKELPLKTNDGVSYKVLQYDQTIGLLVEAVKELTARVKELEDK